ncbi:MAG: hypothetical protein JOY84_17365 [Curvibacter sp.]|nr:hypothetical protein [Curvibacter sp.]
MSGIDVLVARHHHSVVVRDHLLAAVIYARFDFHAKTSRVMSADRFVDGNPRLGEFIASCAARKVHLGCT